MKKAILALGAVLLMTSCGQRAARDGGASRETRFPRGVVHRKQPVYP